CALHDALPTLEACRCERRTDGGEWAFQLLVVGAADRGRPLAGAHQAEQHAQGGRLAGTVGAEEAGDRTRLDREGEVADGLDGAESLRQPAYLDCCSIRHITTITIPGASCHPNLSLTRVPVDGGSALFPQEPIGLTERA